MVRANIPIPPHILAVLGALAELVQAITEHPKQQNTDSGNPGKETLSAKKRQSSTKAEDDHD
jgi:hypothetical protein